MPLTSLQKGRTAVLDKVGGRRRFRRRLMELGLTPGTDIKIVRAAPFGDPIEIEVRGFHISLRKQEAEAISVIPHHR